MYCEGVRTYVCGICLTLFKGSPVIEGIIGSFLDDDGGGGGDVRWDAKMRRHYSGDALNMLPAFPWFY